MNEIRELTEMEVEAVSGGGLVDVNVTNQVFAPTSLALQNAVAVGVGTPANAGNLIGGLTTIGTNLGFQL
jgi:hypothetical protein